MSGYDKNAYVDIDYLSQTIDKPGKISQLFIKLTPAEKANIQTISEELEESLKTSGVKVAGSIDINTIIASNKNQYNFLIYFLLGMAVMVAIVGALGLAEL